MHILFELPIPLLGTFLLHTFILAKWCVYEVTEIAKDSEKPKCLLNSVVHLEPGTQCSWDKDEDALYRLIWKKKSLKNIVTDEKQGLENVYGILPLV